MRLNQRSTTLKDSDLCSSRAIFFETNLTISHWIFDWLPLAEHSTKNHRKIYHIFFLIWPAWKIPSEPTRQFLGPFPISSIWKNRDFTQSPLTSDSFLVQFLSPFIAAINLYDLVKNITTQKTGEIRKDLGIRKRTPRAVDLTVNGQTGSSGDECQVARVKGLLLPNGPRNGGPSVSTVVCGGATQSNPIRLIDGTIKNRSTDD